MTQRSVDRCLTRPTDGRAAGPCNGCGGRVSFSTSHECGLQVDGSDDPPALLMPLGIKSGYRKRGIDAVMFLDTLRAAQRMGFARGEVSWTLDDNELVNRAIPLMGGTHYKTYRMFEKGLS